MENPLRVLKIELHVFWCYSNEFISSSDRTKYFKSDQNNIDIYLLETFDYFINKLFRNVSFNEHDLMELELFAQKD